MNRLPPGDLLRSGLPRRRGCLLADLGGTTVVVAVVLFGSLPSEWTFMLVFDTFEPSTRYTLAPPFTPPIKTSPLKPAASHYQVGFHLKHRGVLTYERLKGFHEPPGICLQKVFKVKA